MRRFGIVLSVALALAPAAALAQGGPFLKTQGPDLWRASQLPGVAVFGPDGKQVGTVADVLMDENGRAADVVIAVGGFLGIGQKDVAVPAAQVHFTAGPSPTATQNATAGAQERSPFLSANGGLMGTGMMMDGVPAPGGKPPAAAAAPASGSPPPPAAAMGGPAGTTAAVPGGQATGLAAMPDAPPGGTAAPARSTARPGRATVDLTAEELKNAPGFTFAP